MTHKDPFLEGTFWDKFWRPIRSRALLFTPEVVIQRSTSKIRLGILFMSGKEKTHKHKQIRGIVPGLGGCQKVFYVFFFFFFFGSFLMGERKHINKIPPKIPGQSRENFVYVFFLYVFFRSLSWKI